VSYETFGQLCSFLQTRCASELNRKQCSMVYISARISYAADTFMIEHNCLFSCRQYRRFLGKSKCHTHIFVEDIWIGIYQQSRTIGTIVLHWNQNGHILLLTIFYLFLILLCSTTMSIYKYSNAKKNR